MVSGAMLSPFTAFAQDADSPPPVNDNGAVVETLTEAEVQAGDLFDQSWLEEQGSPINFTNPMVLFGWPPALLLLWFALRSIPVRPKDVDFGPLFILEQLKSLEAEPNQMKVLEKMIWMGALTGAFFAAADPRTNPQPDFVGDGPIIIAVDTGWASAVNWNKHRESMRELIRHAYNDERNVVFINMAGGEEGQPVVATDPMNPAVAISYIENLSPVPWPTDREAALAAIESLQAGNYGGAYWMSNGLDDAAALDFATALDQIAPLTVYDESNRPNLFMVPEYARGEYTLSVMRAESGEEEILQVSAYDIGYNLIGSEIISFDEEDRVGSVTFNPADYDVTAERIFSFAIDNETGAGATVLVNENYRPRSVGIVARNGQSDTDSLLSEARFLHAALEPFTEIYFGSVEELIDSGDISVLIIPDSTPVGADTIAQQKLESWMNDGGTIIRFAGPNLAQEAHTNDPLLPVDLRSGSHVLVDTIVGGAEGLRVQEFSGDTPFGSITPDETISISRQIIVSPTPDLEERVWARLSDGSPLVTQADRGSGQVILFHTTANTLWSELPYSNNFVDMLVATISHSNSIEDTSDYELPVMPPISVLNGNGELRSPPAIVEPLTQGVIDNRLLDTRHRPGLYGTSLMTVPYNISNAVTSVDALRPLPESITRQYYRDAQSKDEMKGWLWSGAIVLALLGSAVLSSNRKLWGRKQETPKINKNEVRALKL